MYTCIHVLMRESDEKERRKTQARSNKQQGNTYCNIIACVERSHVTTSVLSAVSFTEAAIGFKRVLDFAGRANIMNKNTL